MSDACDVYGGHKDGRENSDRPRFSEALATRRHDILQCVRVFSGIG